MKISKKVLCLLISVLMVASVAVFPASAANITNKKRIKGEYVEGEVIVVLNDNAPDSYSVKSKAAQSYGKEISLEKSFKIDANGGDGVRMAFVKSDKLSTEQIIKSLKNKKSVKYAFPNYKKKVSAITKDTYSNYQWALENTGQNGGTEGADINPEALWDKADNAVDEAVVAVIDTGIDLEHEDLKDVIWTNPYGSKLVGKHGYDFTITTGNGEPKDDNGHGTHVSGIIAGVGDNRKGISGVNKKNVKIMALKAFNSSGAGSGFAEISSYDYIARAAKLGANICAVNCSFGGTGDVEEKKAYDEIYDELGASGIITVVSAGNEFENMDALDPEWYEEGDYLLPAMSDSKYCVTVGASDENDELTIFSNYSEKYVDVAAPGNDILSCFNENCFNPSIYSEAKRADLSAYFQDYDNYTDGDFGGITVSDKEAKDSETSHDATVALSDNHFGDSGKSISVTFNDGLEKGDVEGPFYLLEIPFTLDTEDEPYTISFMGSCTSKQLSGYFVDVPADYGHYFDTRTVFEEYELYPSKGTWDHYNYKVDPEKATNYKKSTNRKLQFYFSPDKGDVLYIDDLAISVQGANEDEFGKYDFMSGTSMATPYVAGAVALVSNCYPEAKALDVKNMVCNTGRVSEALRGKVHDARSLSLDNTEKVPPIISSVGFSKDGKNIEISGTMNDASTVTVNGESVTPISIDEGKAVIPDNGYNTNKIKIELTNVYGTGSCDAFLSNKRKFPITKKVVGEPANTYDLIPVSAGDNAYFVNSESGIVEKLSYKIASDKYVYETVGMINLTGFSKDKSAYEITSAVYSGGKIYFTAMNAIESKYAAIIGYDTAFAYYDLSKKKTVFICEIPNVPVSGMSLAAYNNKFYIIGGYDLDEHSFLDSVYKYNSSTKSFYKLGTNLPEPRAYAQYIVYGNKLVGVYGGTASGEMPSPIIFDGTSWKKSDRTFDSEDKTVIDRTTDGDEIYAYKGNVGIGEKGIFCNGSYIYGIGDTFTYNPESDKVTPSAYSATNSLSEDKIFGTTIAGCFIGFTADEEVIPDDDDDETIYVRSKASSAVLFDDDDDDIDIPVKTAYLLPLKNTASDPAKQTYISLKKSSVGLYVSGTYNTDAKIRNSKGKTTYKSSSSKVAKVSSNGVVTALKKGTAKITVKNNGVERKLTVTVKNPYLNASKKKLKKGKSFKLKITGKIGKARFVSSDKAVATVTSGGKVTAKSKGTATISVTTNGIKLKCKVIVK